MNWEKILPWIFGVSGGLLAGAIITLCALYQRSLTFLASQRSIPRSVEKCLSDIYDKIESRTTNRSVLLGTILMILFGAFYFQYSSNLKEIQEDIRVRAEEHERKLQADAAVELEKLSRKTDAALSEIQNIIQKKIAAEFAAANVSQLIEKRAEQQIDSITERVVAEKTLKLLKSEIKLLEGKLAKNEDAIRYANIVLASQRGERWAFGDLVKAARNPTDIYTEEAKALIEFYKFHRPGPGMGGSGPENDIWTRLGFEPETKNLRDIYEGYMKASLQSERMYLARWIWCQTRFDVIDKIDILIEIIKNDRWIDGANEACSILNQYANIIPPQKSFGVHHDQEYLYYEDFVSWWMDCRGRRNDEIRKDHAEWIKKEKARPRSFLKTMNPEEDTK